MDFKIEKLMDGIGQKILAQLEADARISYSLLGKKVGLSTPAVTERVRKMEEAGIILGYHARIQQPEPDSPVLAFVELTAPARLYDQVKTQARRCDEVVECHHISGDAAFVLKVRVDGVSRLESVVERFSPFGTTRTSIVLSSSKS